MTARLRPVLTPVVAPVLAPVVAVVAVGVSVIAAPLAARADAPVTPDRDQARSWAIQELMKPEYQRRRPGLIEQLWDWLREHLAALVDVKGVPGNLGTAIVATLLIAAVGLGLWRTGSLRRRGRATGEQALFADDHWTAADHRAAADAAEAVGDHRTAVLERFRATVRDLQERALLESRPGLTPTEAATVAAGWLPDLAGDLHAAARSFDDVCYGDLPATTATATALRDLDERVRRARPALVPGPPAGPRVPR